MKLPQKARVYPNDTNLISWLFTVSRNSDLLYRLCVIIEFIHDHPEITEEAMRREYNGMVKIPDNK